MGTLGIQIKPKISDTKSVILKFSVLNQLERYC